MHFQYVIKNHLTSLSVTEEVAASAGVALSTAEFVLDSDGAAT